MSHSQHIHNNMVERIDPRETSDTTYTKIFVGGLAWETQKETMKQYFEQFGEILEAVVIKDKSTGKSKGYGFVTFKDPESAWRACQEPYPIIDGRRANCNLASFGAQKNRSSIPQQGMDKPRQRTAYMASSSFEGTSTYLHHTMPHRGFAYPTYGYPGFSHDLPMNYYNVYGGQQFPSYYPSAMGSPGFYLNYYPFYTQLGQSSSSSSPAAQHSKFTQYPLWSHPYRAPGVPTLPSPASPPFPAFPASRPVTTTVAATPGLTTNDTEQKNI